MGSKQKIKVGDKVRVCGGPKNSWVYGKVGIVKATCPHQVVEGFERLLPCVYFEDHQGKGHGGMLVSYNGDYGHHMFIGYEELELIDTDPKLKSGKLKPGMDSVPPVSLLELGAVLDDGKKKYGAMNWRQTPIRASTYYNAILRHLFAWFDGEDLAEDSGLQHISHIMGNCAVMLDAKASGKLIDDRPENKGMFPKELAKKIVTK